MAVGPHEAQLGVVLDASALLAVIQAEAGAEAVIPRLDGAAISAVNWQEVVAKLAERLLNPDEIAEILAPLALAIHAHDAAQAMAVGLFRPANGRAGLSLGDRACLALARTLDAPVLTANRAWEGLDVGVHVEVVR